VLEREKFCNREYSFSIVMSVSEKPVIWELEAGPLVQIAKNTPSLDFHGTGKG
jgi:hypothetical protein